MNLRDSTKLVHRIRRGGDTRRKRVRAGLLALALGATVTVVASPPFHAAPKGADAVSPKTLLQSAPTSHTSESSSTPKKHWYEIGTASWYGGSFNGRRTANGETFDMTAWTCAHRTLPLGSWIKVTNLHNHRSLFLRVNDRGPVAENFIVDLSYAAAHKLGIGGLGKVKIEQVAPNDPKLIDQLLASVKPRTDVPWPVAKGIGR
jgi:rare lipoprotein A